jgi:hypothetical protein
MYTSAPSPHSSPQSRIQSSPEPTLASDADLDFELSSVPPSPRLPSAMIIDPGIPLPEPSSTAQPVAFNSLPVDELPGIPLETPSDAGRYPMRQRKFQQTNPYTADQRIYRRQLEHIKEAIVRTPVERYLDAPSNTQDLSQGDRDFVAGESQNQEESQPDSDSLVATTYDESQPVPGPSRLRDIVLNGEKPTRSIVDDIFSESSGSDEDTNLIRKAARKAAREARRLIKEKAKEQEKISVARKRRVNPFPRSREASSEVGSNPGTRQSDARTHTVSLVL